ncbi:MAG: nickel-type superoxide dismutase maturation protease [Acidobacteria bacterium]|nr:nickel-type superoxide dismutase maturation protease [Acidobacteriota bacterium]MDW7984741.1 nickel-type superoxide dismutase maturation protease [Acidobacteriota bacterium]
MVLGQLRPVRVGFRWRWRVYRVRGASMAPTLGDGDYVLVDGGAYREGSPQPGDIVVARHPFYENRYIVKRVRAVLEGGRLFLEGDAPYDSTDSHALGPVPVSQVVGRVVRRWPRRR